MKEINQSILWFREFLKTAWLQTKQKTQAKWHSVVSPVKEFNVFKSHYMKNIACKCHIYPSERPFFSGYAAICMTEEIQLNEKHKKWWSKLTIKLLRKLIWFQMFDCEPLSLLWIRKEGKTKMQREQLVTESYWESQVNECDWQKYIRQYGGKGKEISNIDICFSHFPL